MSMRNVALEEGFALLAVEVCRTFPTRSGNQEMRCIWKSCVMLSRSSIV
jgi:hypothetical protein